MKRLSTVLSLFMAVSLMVSPLAEAKKMGGKSMGRTYKTAPAPASPPPQSGNTLKQGQQTSGQAQSGAQQGAQQKSSKMGMLGGALAGLAAGGLLASLFSGGLGGGIGGMLMMLLLAGGAFMLFRKFKAGQQRQSPDTQHQPPAQEASLQDKVSDTFMQKKPAVEGHGQDAQFLESASSPDTPAQPSSGIIGGDDVPVNIPGGFDQAAFLTGAREHYVTLQKAWNENNLSVMKEYMATALFDQLSKERSTLAGNQHTEVLFVDAGIVRADYTARVAQISVKYTGRYKDSQEGVEEDINDVWHLERDITTANSPWLIVGIE